MYFTTNSASANSSTKINSPSKCCDYIRGYCLKIKGTDSDLLKTIFLMEEVVSLKTFRKKDARGILMTVYSYLASVVILFPVAGIQPKKL